MLFAAGLELDREPARWDQFPAALTSWVQFVGLLAFLALLIWTVANLLQGGSRRRFSGPAVLVYLAVLLDVLLYAFFFVLINTQPRATPAYTPFQQTVLTLAALVALAVVLVPPLRVLLGRLSLRRVWALARLSMKEAIRGRVLYVFALLALVFLFASYFVSSKPEDQVRTYVTLIYGALAPLFLVLAGLLGAFSIPRDVTKQTIHTIVTKPVERYEIVLGRFLGYGLLLTVGLFVLTGLSWLYVMRGITPQAAQESYTARVPVWADTLTFHGTGKSDKGESVGREWEYRDYIRGRSPQAAGQPRQYAVWSFASLPADLTTRTTPVPLEYTFDIYRTTKADQGKEGVFCTLTFAPGDLSVPEIEGRARKAEAARRAALDKALPAGASEADLEVRQQQIEDELINQFGVFQATGVFVVDYHTGSLKVPASLFAKVHELHQSAASPLPRGGTEPSAAGPPEMKVLMNVGDDRSSSQQLIGVARRDIYLLPAERPFWQNFFKGALGLWARVLLVLGVALACSTYLSGIISLMCTFFLYGSGLVVDYIRGLAEGRAAGGGPVEAATRLLYRLPMGVQIDPTPAATLGQGIDLAYSRLLRFVLNLVPDVPRFNLTDYVANGFDISWTNVLLIDNFLPLIAYLVPWAVLAFYLMKSREIANPT